MQLLGPYFCSSSFCNWLSPTTAPFHVPAASTDSRCGISMICDGVLSFSPPPIWNAEKRATACSFSTAPRPRRSGRADLHRSAPERDGLEHQRRVQPDRRQRRLRPLRADRHDDRSADLLAARAALSGLVVSRLSRTRAEPRARRRPERPVARSRRRHASGRAAGVRRCFIAGLSQRLYPAELQLALPHARVASAARRPARHVSHARAPRLARARAPRRTSASPASLCVINSTPRSSAIASRSATIASAVATSRCSPGSSSTSSGKSASRARASARR